MDEEARAAAYRTQQETRRAYRKALANSLAGDPAALQTLKDNWEPIIAYQREGKANAYGQQQELEERAADQRRRWTRRGSGEL